MCDRPPGWMNVPLRGSYYRGEFVKEVAKELSSNSQVFLEREPHNAYDRNAIKTFVDLGALGTIHFAYVGREYAAEIAPWMDQGWFFYCQVVKQYGAWVIVNITPIMPMEQQLETSTQNEIEAPKLLPIEA